MPSMSLVLSFFCLIGIVGLIGNRSLCRYGILYFCTAVSDDRKVLRSAFKEELETSWRRNRLQYRLLLVMTALCFGGYAVVATDERPVTAFAYVYPFGKSAGLRTWNLDRLGRWHERGPDGREARLFDVNRRGTVNRCRGSLTNEASQPEYSFFIPDIGCKTMALMLARNGGAWSVLGSMSLVVNRPVQDD